MRRESINLEINNLQKSIYSFYSKQYCTKIKGTSNNIFYLFIKGQKFPF